MTPPPRGLVVGCWHPVPRGPKFNPQSRTVCERRYKNGTSSSLVWHSTFKGKFSRIKIGQKVMDKIWDGNPSKLEVIGHCGGGEKKRLTKQN